MSDDLGKKVPNELYDQEDFKVLGTTNPIFFQYIVDYFEKGSGNTVAFEKNLKTNGLNLLELSIEVLTHFMGQSSSILLSRSEMYIQSQNMAGKEISVEKFFTKNSELILGLCKLIESSPNETWLELVKTHKLNPDDAEWSNLGEYFKSTAAEIKNDLASQDAMKVAQNLQAMLQKYIQIIKS